MSDVDALDVQAITRELRELMGSGGLSALEIRNRELANRDAQRAYNRQCARVRSSVSGTAQAKNDACLLDTECDRLLQAADVAAAALAYAKQCAKGSSEDLSNVQTRARLLTKMLDLGGRGTP